MKKHVAHAAMIAATVFAAAAFAVPNNPKQVGDQKGLGKANDAVQLIDEAHALAAPTPGMLHMRTGAVNTATLADARAAGAFDADRRYVLQLDGPITPERRATIEAAGITLYDYLPHYSYIADMSAARGDQLAALDSVIWVGDYQNAWKLDPEIGQRVYATPERRAIAAQGNVVVMVYVFEGMDRVPAIEALEANNAVIHSIDQLGGNPMIAATMPFDRVANLAAVDVIQFVEDAFEITPRNNEVRWVVQSNQLNVTPLYDHGLTGAGQIVGVLDTQIRQDHCSFHDPTQPPPSGTPNPNHRKILAYNQALGNGSHGTHVAGTIAGLPLSGAWDNTRGVAFDAKIVHNSWPSPLAGNEAGVIQRLTLHHDQGGRIHTNSWGNDGTTAYDGLARGFDIFQWNNEESQTFLAVTNQTSGLKNPENAKNLLAVGATQKAPNHHNHCYGGAGPTIDGRRKPEVYAPGCSTNSSSSGSTCGTNSSSGTSMACPAVAGVGTLVRQYYMDGYYPTGEPDSGNAFTPSGALIKATIVNSAVDLTGVAGYPSNLEGWGRVLIQNSLRLEDSPRKLLVTDVRNADGLSTGGEHEETVYVNNSSEQLRVTLVWTDFPGATNSNPSYVNNLDLEVEGPNGLFLGNVFSGGVSVTGGSADFRNNVEQVHIPNPGEGEWTIRVKGTNVAQQTQGFALVVTGDITVQEPPLSVSVVGGTPGIVPPGDPISFQVRIRPGQESIVPGSETLNYRFDGGLWNSVPLVHDTGEFYWAHVPAANCGDEPQYWVSAQGDGGTIRTAPSNAPINHFSTLIGVMVTDEIYSREIDGPGFPAGWTSTGLWNVSNACAVGTPCVPGPWAYYGIVSTCTFNSGAANQGALTSESITLPTPPPGGNISVEFCYTLQTENNPTYDKAEFRVVGTPINIRLAESPSAWTTFSADVTSLAGQTVQLRWNFDTVDGVLNNFRGWQVDNVRISATGFVCEPVSNPCPADLNGDGVVDVVDMLELFAAWGPNPGHPADLNGDGEVDVVDMLELFAAWGPCP